MSRIRYAPSLSLLLVLACEPPVEPDVQAVRVASPDAAASLGAAAADRAALAALYEATGGPNWGRNDKWLTDAPLGEWAGVAMNDAGRVVSLDLYNNGLTGEIPPELGSLGALESLNVGGNDLTGPIPSELGNLTALERLRLGGNDLTGPVPPELGNLAALERLGLGSNHLTGEIPPELGNLAALERLGLGGNHLTGPIPPELGNLAVLERLYLSDNDLTGPIPPELGDIAALRWLYLSNNGLTGPIPPELGNLAALEWLYLYGNPRLTGEIPPELGNLAALTWLDLSDNDLTGPIPLELGNLAALGYLGLYSNDLTGPIPPELGNLAALTGLWLSDNDLTGPIPPELENLAALERLHLGGNDLTGPIPPELGNLAALTGLWLSDNDLTGPIPPELGNLAALTRLVLRGNPGLTGPFPVTLLNLTELEHFGYHGTDLCLPGTESFWRMQVAQQSWESIYCNDYDRSVLQALYTATAGADWTRSDGWNGTPVLGNWHGVAADSLGRVTGFVLSGNNMAGGVAPVPLGALTELTSLDIEDNPRLRGPLPLSLTRVQLDTLRFAGTGLCIFPEAHEWLEAIPVARGNGATCEPLSDHDVLVTLYGMTGGPDWRNSDNWLTETPLGEWAGVTVNDPGRVVSLDLYNNGLTGEIPPELGNLAALRELWLSINPGLTGEIPPKLGNLTALEQLFLGGNGLTGPIPPELGNLAALEQLFLGGNGLTGPIPPELGNLAALEELGLSGNDLTGPIPPELGNLAALWSLYLYDNGLTGEIPPELGNLTALEELGLSGNDLTGPIPPELGNLAALTWLDLSGNDLTGPFPPELGNLAALRWLYLYDNEGLSGPLPLTLTAAGRLEGLNTSNTGLCAPTDRSFQWWAAALRVYRVRLCEAAPSAYLVQAIQNPDYLVPLVAGRDALLRVFPTAPFENAVPVPPVRASFYVGELEMYTVDVPGKPGPLPVEIDESDLAVSANLRIPGGVLRPGLEMVVEIDPEGTLDPSLGIARRFPAEGRAPLDVRALPTMELTLVPFLHPADPDSSIIALVDGIAADPEVHELLRVSRAVLPASDWSVTPHHPVLFGGRNLAILNRIAAIRAMEGGRGYWMALTGTAGGVAQLSGWVSVASQSGYTIAHELGHNMSLAHAPCGAPEFLDGAFPDSRGRIGAWGYDFAGDSLISPDVPDVMGYCDPSWVSDYHFTNAFGHRVWEETSATPTRSLLLWGGEREGGGPYLEPAFVVDAVPMLPDSAGGYTLEGLDAGGRVLFSLSFAMPAIADAGEAAGSFVYTLPVRPGWEALASVTLTAPDGRVATLDGSTDRPMAILRDPRTGRVRAFLDGAEATVQADGGDGEDLAATLGAVAITSRGLPAPDAWQR